MRFHSTQTEMVTDPSLPLSGQWNTCTPSQSSSPSAPLLPVQTSKHERHILHEDSSMLFAQTRVAEISSASSQIINLAPPPPPRIVP